MSRKLRRIGIITLAIAITVGAFGAAVVGGIIRSGQPAATEPRPIVQSTPLDAEHIDDRIVVAVVLGASGSDTADVLAPYEVFASSDAFAVFTIADSAAPAALDGGLWVQPDFTFADYYAGTTPAPDLVVVPAVNLPADAEEQGAREFVKDTHAAGSSILGVCAGSRLLAAAGVLSGLTATSHWSRIGALEESNPDVNWVRGQRYVQDGDITTTGGVTSSIYGSLRVMADLAGDAEAERVGKEIDYPGWSLTGSTRMEAKSFEVGDLPVLVNTAFPWMRSTIDIGLTDGVDELDAAALFEVYNYSQSASTRALSEEGRVVTRHGLTLLTGRLCNQSALEAGSLVSANGEGGFDAAFEHLALTVSPAVVDSVSKMLEYPLDRVDRTVRAGFEQWRPVAVLTLAAIIAIALGSLPILLRRRSKKSQ